MSKINTNKEKIQALLTRGVANVYPDKKYLESLLMSGKQLTLYLGIDPTAPTLHLGSAVIIEKLRQFQELGHQIILLLGDYTAMIGDPTDKKATRQVLTREQVLANAKDYKKQLSKIISLTGANKAELKYNSQWFAKMNFAEVLKLTTNFTVQQLLERDMFAKRMKEGKAVSLQELIYPVMQAYDSVMMKVDGEIGGNDQTFNMLAGRTLMKSLLNKEKFVLTTKLLTDASGVKMGKTEGNMAMLNESPEQMFGKIMSWTDGMILPGLELCTRLSMDEISKIEKKMKQGANPKEFKVLLAKEIIKIFHSAKDADLAEANFSKVFSHKENPDDIKEYYLAHGIRASQNVLGEMHFASSMNESRRLIEGGAFKINGKKITNPKEEIDLKSGDIIQVGKRKFGKVK